MQSLIKKRMRFKYNKNNNKIKLRSEATPIIQLMMEGHFNRFSLTNSKIYHKIIINNKEKV